MNSQEYMMRAALNAASPWLGSASPNPTVGAAAFDKAGQLLASAAHTFVGQPHAEAKLLETCKQNNTLQNIDTLAITLEPCNHHGRTPPCTDTILKSPIKNILVGLTDPNPVAKGGLDRLRAAGKNVITGVLARECWHQMAGFMVRHLTARPCIILKIAVNEQGSMIPPIGHKTFTGLQTLTLSHRLRKRADAILTGAGTVLTDQPLFTVRHVPDYSGKKRYVMVMDRRGRLDVDDMTPYLDLGFETLTSDDLDQAIRDLAVQGCNSVLVEAGPSLSREIMVKNLWDILVIIKKNTDGSDSVYTGRNPTKALLSGLDPFSISDFLPNEPNAAAIHTENVSDPADTLRQLSDLRI